jgi:chemotaxis protein methyltransferase CheR
MNSQIRERYFKPKAGAGAGAYEISPMVKNVVAFQKLNLFDHQYPAQLNSIDVIFYRNVSIYFSGDAQKEIFGNLSKLLENDGYIFLASSETYFHNIGILFLHDMDGAFVYQKRIDLPVEDRRTHRASHAQGATLPSPRHPAKAEIDYEKFFAEKNAPKKKDTAVPEERRDPHAMFDEALAKAINKEYSAAIATIKSLLDLDKDFKKAYSLKASIFLNMQDVAQADVEVGILLEKDEWNVEGLLLSGIIEKTRGNEDEAVKQFKKAIYIKPQCWLAHFYMAEIYYGLDDLRGAAYEYGVVASILEKDVHAAHDLSYFPLSFPTDQLARLCRHNIGKISRGLLKNAGV